MPTSSTNNRSQQLNARFPHDVIEEMEKVIEAGEKKSQFIVTSVRNEIKRRLRNKTKQAPQS